MAIPDGVTEEIGGYPVHPVASMFPMSDDETLRLLADDIAANGQHEPVVLAEYWPDPYLVLAEHGVSVERGEDIEGRDFGPVVNEALATPELVVLDGRNRLRACELAGVEPLTIQHIPGTTAVMDSLCEGWEEFVGKWIVSKNLHRRHLSTGQRAAVAAKWVEYFAVEARKRQGFRSDLNPDLSAKLQKGSEGFHASAKAAEMFNVSPRSVATAKKVMEQDPEKFLQVEKGEIAPSRAEKEIKAKQQPTPPTKQELLAAREAIIQKEADRLLKKYSKDEITILLHYIHLGKEKDNA